MNLFHKMINITTVLVFVLTLVIASSVQAQPFEPSITLIWDGSGIESISPGVGVPVPAGSSIDVGSFNGHLVISISTPDAAAPGPDIGNHRITSPAGTTFEIPNSGSVTNVTQVGETVSIEYRDGSTVELPGTHLPPGTPNPDPDTSMQPGELNFEDGFGELSVEEATDFFTALIAEDWSENLFGFPLTLDNLPYDFGGIDPFPIGEGIAYISYVDGAQDNIVAHEPVPEPSTMLLVASGLLGLARFRKRFRKR